MSSDDTTSDDEYTSEDEYTSQDEIDFDIGYTTFKQWAMNKPQKKNLFYWTLKWEKKLNYRFNYTPLIKNTQYTYTKPSRKSGERAVNHLIDLRMTKHNHRILFDLYFEYQERSHYDWWYEGGIRIVAENEKSMQFYENNTNYIHFLLEKIVGVECPGDCCDTSVWYDQNLVVKKITSIEEYIQQNEELN